MRLFKLGMYYPVYLDRFYAERPHLAAASYHVQHAALIADRVASSDFWTRALQRRGYETCDTIANARPLQQRWAQEHGVPFDDDFVTRLTIAQICAFRPDVLLVADYSTFGAAFLSEIRQRCPSILLILGWCGAPYHDASVMRSWDVALSCIPEMVEGFRADGLDAHHVNHGFEPRILEQLQPRAHAPRAFTFLGSIVKLSRFHEERERILQHLVTSTPLEIWSDISQPDRAGARRLRLKQVAFSAVSLARRGGVPNAVLRHLPVVRRAARWETRPEDNAAVDSRIARRAKPPLFGLSMFQQLRDSDVTLNTHIDVSPRSASNMRLFEATGTGVCLLTDWKDNLADLFEPDSEVVTYRSAAEAAEKFAHLATHPVQRAMIAAAGQRRALRDHNFDTRAERIDAIVRDSLRKRG